MVGILIANGADVNVRVRVSKHPTATLSRDTSFVCLFVCLLLGGHDYSDDSVRLWAPRNGDVLGSARGEFVCCK